MAHRLITHFNSCNQMNSFWKCVKSLHNTELILATNNISSPDSIVVLCLVWVLQYFCNLESRRSRVRIAVRALSFFGPLEFPLLYLGYFLYSDLLIFHSISFREQFQRVAWIEIVVDKQTVATDASAWGKDPGAASAIGTGKAASYKFICSASSFAR